MRRILLSLSLLLLVPLLMAPHYSNWHAFSNGEVADALEVNENFVFAAAALDNFETRVSALEAAAQMFLTTDACPAGYNAVENGYIKLGSTGLTTTASSRTLVNPAHTHSHSLQSDYDLNYYHDTNGIQLADAFSGGVPIYIVEPTLAGSHAHDINGTVGSGQVSGDTAQAITGHMEHITLRLCVRTQ